MLMECEGFWPTVSSILGWVLATYSGFLLGRFWPTLSVSGNGFKDAVNTPYDSSQGRQAAPQRGNSPSPGQATVGSDTLGWGLNLLRFQCLSAFLNFHRTPIINYYTLQLKISKTPIFAPTKESTHTDDTQIRLSGDRFRRGRNELCPPGGRLGQREGGLSV